MTGRRRGRQRPRRPNMCSACCRRPSMRASRRRLRTEPALRADLRFWRSAACQPRWRVRRDPGSGGGAGRASKRGCSLTQRRPQRLLELAASVARPAPLARWPSRSSPSASTRAPRAVDPKPFATQLVAALQCPGQRRQLRRALRRHHRAGAADCAVGRGRARQGLRALGYRRQQRAHFDGRHPGRRSAIDVRSRRDILAGFGAGTVLAVTLEQKGGSPTGGPQGPIVADGHRSSV